MKNFSTVLLLSLLLMIVTAGYSQTKISELSLISIHFKSEAELSSLIKKYDVWHIDPLKQRALILVSDQDLSNLEVADLEIIPEIKRTNSLKSLTFPMPGYQTVEEIYAAMNSLADEYPELVDLFDYGDSWEKVTSDGKSGYDLFALKITNKKIATEKPPIVIDGGIHAREMAPPEVVLKYAFYLLDNYGKDPDISWLVDYREIHIIPMLNPDGRKMAELGLMWRKNTNSQDGCDDSTSWGVDLNRNYPFKWGVGEGSSSAPSSQTFRGSSPASEPEIYFYLDYVRDIIPDQRGTLDRDAAPDSAFGAYVNCHSFGNVVLHPWGFTADSPPNDELIDIAKKMANLSNYDYNSSLYPVNGVARDWAYGELGCISYTIEMGEDFFQSYEDIPIITEENIRMFKYLTKIADHPYISIYGPDVTDITIDSSEVARGDSVLISAKVNDAYNRLNFIAEAEIFVVPMNDSSFETRTAKNGISMIPSDGSANDVIENYAITLNTNNFEPGKYYLFIRGKDVNGFQGPFSAAYLSINNATRVDDDFIAVSPRDYVTFENYPNPFSSSTVFRLNLNRPGNISIKIYNLLGQFIQQYKYENVTPGVFNVNWDGKNNQGILVPDGIYFAVLETGKNQYSRKILLIQN